METIECIIDGHNGRYVPQCFVESFDLDAWHIEGLEAVQYVLAGPDNEYYWEAWDFVLDAAYLIDEQGKKWTLYPGESGDLFMVRGDHEWQEWE